MLRPLFVFCFEVAVLSWIFGAGTLVLCRCDVAVRCGSFSHLFIYREDFEFIPFCFRNILNVATIYSKYIFSKI
jgi:hypothetical protein